ncbi:MAG: glycosyltransferase family 2 protein [Solidesulfovibrio sp.]
MSKHPLGLSVVTYTYDDHELAAGLLASIAGWDCQPREICVVDDGSGRPFLPPDGQPAPKVIRLSPNRGPAMAKATGLGAATQRFLLSLDADIRLSPDWVTCCLPLAANPEVGLVGSPILTDAGEGLLADYQRLRFSHLVGFTGEAKVVPAGVWLLRREVWRDHGFAEYDQTMHEDDYFCQKLRQAGLKLCVNSEVTARQVRRLSRHTMVRRGWTWQGREFLAAARKNEIDAINAFLLAMRGRMAKHHAVDRRFAYYDYLYCTFALANLTCEAGHPAAVASALVARLAFDLPAPELGVVFCADMTVLGFPPVPADAHPLVAAIRQGIHSILPSDFDAAVQEALPHLLAEDRREDWHFSFYDI